MLPSRIRSTVIVTSSGSDFLMKNLVPARVSHAYLVASKGLTEITPKHPFYMFVTNWSSTLVLLLRHCVIAKVEDSSNEIASTVVSIFYGSNFSIGEPKGNGPQSNSIKEAKEISLYNDHSGIDTVHNN